MSRTTEAPVQVNPCKKFLKWKNVRQEKDVDGEKVKILKEGTFVYWDKELEEEVPIKLPLKFVVLDSDRINFNNRYSKIEEAYLSSNEVRSKFDPVNKTICKEDQDNEIVLYNYKKRKEVLRFPIKDEYKVKALLESHNASKKVSLYVAVNNNNEWEIWNLQLEKSQLSGGIDRKKKDKTPEEREVEKTAGWWNFSKVYRNKYLTNFIEITKFDVRKSEMGKYTIPKFEIGERISKEEGEIFDELDTQLQNYFSWYDAKPKSEIVSSIENSQGDDIEDDDSYPGSWDDVND